MRKNFLLNSLLVSFVLLVSGCGDELTGPTTTKTGVASRINTPPVATAANISAVEDTVKMISMSGTDDDSDNLTFHISSNPTHGSLSVIDSNQTYPSGSGPLVSYTPSLNYHGADSFTFYVNDSVADSDPVTISISVASVNDHPVAQDLLVTTNEDTLQPFVLSGSDVEGSALVFSIVSGPSHGSLSGLSPNQIYTPNLNYNGPDVITYKANDGTDDSDIAATVTITVNAVNDAPVANPQPAVATNEDTNKSITLTGSDIEGSALTYQITQNPLHGFLSGLAPNVVYHPNANYNGSDNFKFKVKDSANLDSALATVSISVNSVNDAPVNLSDVTGESVGGDKVFLLPEGYDADGDFLKSEIVVNPANGDAQITGNGLEIVYVPNSGFIGIDSFEFRLLDGNANSGVRKAYVLVRDKLCLTGIPLFEQSKGLYVVLVDSSPNAEGSVKLEVAKTDEKITLVLATNNFVHWNIGGEGAGNVVKVFIRGLAYNDSKIEGADQAEIVRLSSLTPFDYVSMKKQYTKFIGNVRKHGDHEGTSKLETSFLGYKQAEKITVPSTPKSLFEDGIINGHQGYFYEFKNNQCN